MLILRLTPRGGHGPGDDRRGGLGPAAGGGRRRGQGFSPGVLGGGQRRLRHPDLCGGVRALGLHVVGRLRKDAVLRFSYTGPHARRPGHKRQFDGCFDRRDRGRMA